MTIIPFANGQAGKYQAAVETQINQVIDGLLHYSPFQSFLEKYQLDIKTLHLEVALPYFVVSDGKGKRYSLDLQTGIDANIRKAACCLLGDMSQKPDFKAAKSLPPAPPQSDASSSSSSQAPPLPPPPFECLAAPQEAPVDLSSVMGRMLEAMNAATEGHRNTTLELARQYRDSAADSVQQTQHIYRENRRELSDLIHQLIQQNVETFQRITRENHERLAAMEIERRRQTEALMQQLTHLHNLTQQLSQQVIQLSQRILSLNAETVRSIQEAIRAVTEPSSSSSSSSNNDQIDRTLQAAEETLL